MTILVLEFEKRESDEKKYDTFCLNYNLLFQSTNLWLIAVVSNYPKN